MNSIEIGHYLSELRKYYKMTQDKLAGLIGVSRQAISKWECGSSIPDIEMLLRLSRLYGVSVNDIAEADVTKIRYAKDIAGEGTVQKADHGDRLRTLGGLSFMVS